MESFVTIIFHMLGFAIFFGLSYWIIKLICGIPQIAPIAGMVRAILLILLALAAMAFFLGEFGLWGDWGFGYNPRYHHRY